MSTRSFKSVGELRTARKYSAELIPDPKPVSIKTPISKDNSRTDLFDCHFYLQDSVHDNLKNLILTNSGERLGRTTFGANLRQLTTELTAKEDFETEAMLRISDQVTKFMPFVELDTFESDLIEEGNTLKFAEADHQAGIGIITIKVIYSVPQLAVMKRPMAVHLHCVG